MKRLLAFLALALWSASAFAADVTTYPVTATTTVAATLSVTATNTFQIVFAKNATRRGCTIQNNGTHNMYVTESLGIAASTLTNSAILAAGQVYYCSVNGAVLIGEIDITGTITDAFYAAQY